MNVLRRVGDYELNEGDGPAKGMYNVTNDLLINFTRTYGCSLWFDFETKDSLLKINDRDFMMQCRNLIKTADDQIDWLKAMNNEIEAGSENGHDISNISDGWHTFSELYEFRKLYNAALFNEWAKVYGLNVHKSKRHFDGELCFGGGWFIVVAELPTGQISNHYKIADWDLFKIPQYDKAKIEFDGHTGKDVIERIKNFILTK